MPIPNFEGYQVQGCLNCDATYMELTPLVSSPGVFTAEVHVKTYLFAEAWGER